jgi:acetolactate synthase-1/2/3 large subunit
VTDGGSYARWVHRYWRFKGPRTQAGPISGAMGYGAPGAIGAQLARPASPVVAFVGDGSFLMSAMELATAAEENVPIKLIVCDNAAHGSILSGQAGRYGAEGVFHTRLKSPDFGALGRAFGLPAWRVERTADFASAFEAALKHPGPALLHLLTDERDIVPFGPGKDAV